MNQTVLSCYVDSASFSCTLDCELRVVLKMTLCIFPEISSCIPKPD